MSDFETIPQQAIDHLIANPESAQGFDQVFGAGRSAEVFANQNPVPEAKPKEDESWSVTGEFLRAIGGGVRDAAQETGNFAKFVGDTATDLVFGQGNDIFYTDNGWEVKNRIEAATDQSVPAWQQTVAAAPIMGDGGLIDLPEVDANQILVGGLGRGVVQFAAGYASFAKITKLSGLKAAFVNGALADAIVFNPNDPNINAMLREWGLDTGSVGEALATNPDDPEYMNRLRNVAEGVLAGGIVEALGWSLRAARASKAGRTADAAEFTAKQDKALRAVDDALAEAGDAVRADVQESLDLSKKIFKLEPEMRVDDVATSHPTPDADGQVRMDLGDTPRAAPIAGADNTPNRIYLTPEKAEKIRLQATLAQGAPWGVKQAGLSWRSLNTVRDFGEVIDDIAGTQAVLADEFTKIRGGDVQRWNTVRVESAARVRQMARMTGEDPEALVKQFLEANLGDPAKMAAEIHARSSYLLTIEQDLKEMAQAITTGAFDPKKFPGIRDLDHLRLAFSQRREVAANLLAGQNALRSNVARAMNAMKMAVKGDEQLRDMLRDPTLFRDVDSAARAVADNVKNGVDVSAIKTIDDTLSKIHGYMDKINTFRINALLSGPGTQEVNFISNVVNSFVIPTEQAMGAIAKGDYRMLVHATRQLQGYMAGLMDSVKAAAQAGWWDDAILDGANTKIDTQGWGHATTVVGKVIGLPTRALMTMDEFFKQSQYRGRIFADASEEATQKGLKGEARGDHIRKYLKDSFGVEGEAIRPDALLQARRATFTEPLEGGVASTIQMWAIKNPAIRFVIPFVRTPANILSQTFQHMPVVSVLSKRWKADIEAGGARAAQAWGRWIVGSALIGMAGTMASRGQITGSGPSDPRIRKVWLQNNQPYAFKIENDDGTVTWVSYARLEPLSNVFSIAADFAEIKNDSYNEMSTHGYLEALFMGIMENTVNKTFTQGIYDAMTIMSGTEPYKREAALRNMMSSFVPNIVNQLNGDEALRETRSLADAILAKTHLYNGVDPKRNVLGEVVVRRLPKFDPIGLTVHDNREIDVVLAEVTRVAINNQSVADSPARRLAGPSRIDLSTIPYQDGQSVYDRWLELTGTVEIGGLTLRDKLAQTIASRSYRAAPDGFIGASSGTKGAIIRRVITAYRTKAKSELPQLVELIQAERRGGASILRDQAHSNRELFPSTNTPQVSTRRRTFEDLLRE